ncbi:3-keto-disaccharide hydrolase [Flagellimonas sp. W118]|uniref:3-keto-disaccharide hydrolase n=1 Tax=Flagellimonas sp. W118 TaxID=3410791 RepID=UPI003BF50B6F
MNLRIKPLFPLVSIFVLLNVFIGYSQKFHPVEGRWDLEMEFKGETVPSWLEVRHSGHETLVGRFVFAFGSARPISEVRMHGNKFSFDIPRQWEPVGNDMIFHGELIDNILKGTMVYTDGSIATWKGVRAPEMAATENPEWGKPMALFNGKNLDGWYLDSENNQWSVEKGILKNAKGGANLISNQKFTDFRLKVEFRYPEGSNSGIYLRGRYEVQIADNKGLEPSDIYFSGIYGFLEPNENTAKNPDEWQSYDITLLGRRVTIIANGKTVISGQTIPGITGGALDSKEGEPGPLMIQGDHGPVEFRKFEVIPIK